MSIFYRYAEFHYAECRYTEFRGAQQTQTLEKYRFLLRVVQFYKSSFGRKLNKSKNIKGRVL